MIRRGFENSLLDRAYGAVCTGRDLAICKNGLISRWLVCKGALTISGTAISGSGFNVHIIQVVPEVYRISVISMVIYKCRFRGRCRKC